jgi:flavin-dependent thymidylate synthase
MKVTLISYTQDAEDLLIFTKSTRLTLRPGMLEEIKTWSAEQKEEHLAYMANTIRSSWEFVDYVFLVEGVSRAYTHQQVRTRAASYAQQTMRMLPMKNFHFIWPEKIYDNPSSQVRTRNCLKAIQETYTWLTSNGFAAEDARSILPTNIATNIICKFNLRNFADLVASRSGGRTQDEYRKVVQAMADEVLKVHPWAEKFLYQQGRDYFKEIEDFAGSLNQERKAQLLKIVDKLRGSK